jgi:hypothetical protein
MISLNVAVARITAQLSFVGVAVVAHEPGSPFSNEGIAVLVAWKDDAGDPLIIDVRFPIGEIILNSQRQSGVLAPLLEHALHVMITVDGWLMFDLPETLVYDADAIQYAFNFFHSLEKANAQQEG